MRKVMRCVVIGAKKVGKTAILQQLTHFHDISNQVFIFFCCIFEINKIFIIFYIILDIYPNNWWYISDSNSNWCWWSAKRINYISWYSWVFWFWTIGVKKSLYSGNYWCFYYLNLKFFNCFKVADAFILVYSVTNHESFKRMDLAKKFIDRQFSKEKREVLIF